MFLFSRDVMFQTNPDLIQSLSWLYSRDSMGSFCSGAKSLLVDTLLPSHGSFISPTSILVLHHAACC